MGKKNPESKNGFLQFSDNLSELIAPVFKGRLKHGFVIVCVILLVIAVIGFIWRSIIHHYVDGLALGESLSIAFAELVTRYVLWLLIGFIVFVCLWLIAAVLKTIGQKNAQKRAELEAQEQTNLPEAVAEVKIDTGILKAYLSTRRMTLPCEDEGKTVFDKLVEVLEDMLKEYKKHSKSKINYTDKDFIQIATILYDRKYQNTQNSAFNAWCRSFFKALGLEEPKDIKKTREVDFDARITKLKNFLPKEDFA